MMPGAGRGSKFRFTAAHRPDHATAYTVWLRDHHAYLGYVVRDHNAWWIPFYDGQARDRAHTRLDAAAVLYDEHVLNWGEPQ